MTPVQYVSCGVWALLAVFGGLTVYRRSEPPTPCSLKAERRLPVGFRLGDGDWSGPDGVRKATGKYADQEYPRGAAMCADKLDEIPKVVVSKDHHALMFDTPASHLNAGATVWLAGKGWTIDAPVLTVLCPNGVCNAIVVAVADTDVVKASAQPPPSVLLRSLP